MQTRGNALHSQAKEDGGGGVRNREAAKEHVLVRGRSLKLSCDNGMKGWWVGGVGALMRLKPAWVLHREVCFWARRLLF